MRAFVALLFAAHLFPLPARRSKAEWCQVIDTAMNTRVDELQGRGPQAYKDRDCVKTGASVSGRTRVEAHVVEEGRNVPILAAGAACAQGFVGVRPQEERGYVEITLVADANDTYRYSARLHDRMSDLYGTASASWSQCAWLAGGTLVKEGGKWIIEPPRKVPTPRKGDPDSECHGPSAPFKK